MCQTIVVFFLYKIDLNSFKCAITLEIFYRNNDIEVRSMSKWHLNVKPILTLLRYEVTSAYSLKNKSLFQVFKESSPVMVLWVTLWRHETETEIDLVVGNKIRNYLLVWHEINMTTLRLYSHTVWIKAEKNQIRNLLLWTTVAQK